MGKSSPKEAQNPVTGPLVDFLYIDRERFDSFISQITTGTLRSVTKIQNTSESSSHSIAGDVKVLRGEISKAQTSGVGSAEKYDPFYWQVINLLNTLSTNAIKMIDDGLLDGPKLATFKGKLTVRDSNSIGSISSSLVRNPTFFGISAKDREAKNNIKMMDELIQLLPNSISIGIELEDKNIISGTLNPSGLKINKADIVQQYGATLPGSWFIFGIFDYSQSDAVNSDIKFSPTEGIISNLSDKYSNTLNSLCSSGPYKIIPVIIYRAVSLI